MGKSGSVHRWGRGVKKAAVFSAGPPCGRMFNGCDIIGREVGFLGGSSETCRRLLLIFRPGGISEDLHFHE